MSSLRKTVLAALVAVHGAGLVAAGAEAGGGANSGINYASVAAVAGEDALVAALPERSLPGLEVLLRRGLEEGPRVLMERWQVEQARANARGERAPMLPSVSGTVSGGIIYEQRQSSPEPDRTLAAVLYNLGLTQPVYHWGALSKRYEMAKLQGAIAERNLGETRRQLALELRRRYFECVLGAGALELGRRNFARLEEELVFVKGQVAAGFESSAATGAIEAAIASMELELLKLAGDQDAGLRAVRRLAGGSESMVIEVAAVLPSSRSLGAAIEALSPDAQVLMSVRQQNLEDLLQSERLNYEVQRTRLKPKFGVSLYATQDNKNPDGDALGQKVLLTTWNAFATMNWSIFDGFAAQAAQRVALSRVRSYEVEQRQLSAQERDERRAEAARLKILWRQLEKAEQNLANAQVGIAQAERDRDAGWAPAAEVSAARRGVEGALQGANAVRAEFYAALATHLSNRGRDPVLRSAVR